MIRLHDFQEAAVQAARGIIARNSSEIIVMPAGSGKSVVAAAIARDFVPSGRRLLILSHVKEIVEQDVAAIRRLLPEHPIGIACSGLGRIEMGRQITVGSIQTLHRRTYAKRPYDAIVIDEAQLISRIDASMYRKLIDANVGPNRGKIPIIGLTATPYRLDTGYLHRGDGALFQRIAYEVPILPLLNRGLLAPLVTQGIAGVNFDTLPRKTDFDVESYTLDGSGEWLAESKMAIERAIAEARDRRKWIVYCCTIRHAEAVAAVLAERGISVATIHSKMSSKRRDEAIAAFRRGEYRVLVNVNIVTIGFDVPDVDCIVLLRPTLSTGLYVQMCGRGMRVAEGKRDCLVLDFAGNAERHGPLVDLVPKLVNVTPASDMKGRAWTCPGCQTPVPAFTRQCKSCGHLFAAIDGSNPSTADILPPHAMLSSGNVQQGRRGKQIPKPSPPAADAELLATEEVAWMLKTTVQYIKQMRTLGMGPAFRKTGGMTGLGWRQVVYSADVVHNWLTRITVTEGKTGRTYRLTPEGMHRLRVSNDARKTISQAKGSDK